MLSNTTISGYLGQKPEVRETPKGHRVATVRIAVNDRRLAPDAIWFNVDQWDDAADRAAQYLESGQYVTAEGLIAPEIYTDRNGVAQLALRMKHAYISYGPKPVGQEAAADQEPGESRSDQQEVAA